MTPYLETFNSIVNHHFLSSFTIKKVELLKSQGICNLTYLLTTLKNKYIIKKFDKTLHSNTNIKIEYLIQFKAYKKNIGSKPIFIDIKNQIYISNFLEGIHKNILNKYDLRTLAQALFNIHKIKIYKKPYNVVRYLTKNNKKISKDLKLALINLRRFKQDFVLCHNDLNPKNIIFTDEIKFIDWEFASINDRYFDLASIIIEFNLNRKYENYFLKYYFKKGKQNRKKLETYKIIYKHTCKIWFDKIS